MISPAFTIAILAAIESLLSCVVSDGMIGGNHRSNAELVGQGVGNIMSALFGGIPATGAIARTAANVKNGGRTPVAGMVHAFTLLLILLFLMPYASLIPMTCLASILMIVGYNMSGWRTVGRMIKRAPKSDVAVLLVTFVLTVFFDLVVAIEFGMVLAAFLFLKRMSDVAQIRQWVDKENLDDPVLSEEYLPAVDQRVLVYRKLAAAEDLESIDEVQEETEAAHGELPLAGLNLFNRARIRIRGERLGLESVTLSGGRITFLGVDVPKKVAFEFKNRYGAVNFPKSRKLSVPYKAGAGAGSGLGRGLDANDGTGPVAAALMLLQQLGATDDD